LHVDKQIIDLTNVVKIYVIGAGKATFPIALALEDILSDKIDDGAVICKYGQNGQLKYSRLYHASYPSKINN